MGTYVFTKINDSITEKQYNEIAMSISKKSIEGYKKSPKVHGERIGNQNCFFCTLCAELQIRGEKVFPRPVYSPRDVIFKIIEGKFLTDKNTTIVIDGVKEKIKSKKELEDKVKSIPNSRYYVHINWKGSNDGHTFLAINVDGKAYILDAQMGVFEEFNDDKDKDGIDYFDINYKNSFVVRIDDKKINPKYLKYNDMKYFTPWDNEKDAKYLDENQF